MKQTINKLIIKLNKHLGIDVYSFTKQSGLVSFPLLFQASFALLVSIIFTRVVSTSVFGEYQFFLAILGTFALFSMPGMDAALVQSVARKHDCSLIKAINTRFKWAILGSLLMLGISFYLKFIHTVNTPAWIYYLLAAIFFPFVYTFLSSFSYLLGKQKFPLYSKYFSCYYITINIFLISSILIFREIVPVITTYLLITSITGLLFYLKIKNKFSKEIKESPKDKEVFKFGFNLSLIEVIPLLASHADKIILGYFLGFETLAIYYIALSFPSNIRLVIKPLTRLILPKHASRTDTDYVFNFLKKKIPYMLVASLLIIISGILLIPYVIKLFFPPEYNASIQFAQILFLAFVFSIPSHIFNQFLVSQKMTNSILKVQLINNISKIAALAILIPLFGIYGAIASIIIANYSFFGSTIYYSWKGSKEKEETNKE